MVMHNHHHKTQRNERVLYHNLFNTKNPTYPYQNEQHGYGFPQTVFKGSRRQRGYGLGNIISSLFRKVVPLLAPILKSAAKGVGKRMLKGGINIAENVLSGGDVKEAVRNEAQSGLSDLSSSAMGYVGKKINARNTRKRKNTRRQRGGAIKRRGYAASNDIFD